MVLDVSPRADRYVPVARKRDLQSPGPRTRETIDG
jgi:hypothetical protein